MRAVGEQDAVQICQGQGAAEVGGNYRKRLVDIGRFHKTNPTRPRPHARFWCERQATIDAR